MKLRPRNLLSHSLGGLVVVSALFAAGCVHYDIPRQAMQAPGADTWAVSMPNSHPGYHVTSFTRLNGAVPLSGKPTVAISTGSDGDWQWTVKAVPSVAQSWRAWLAYKKTQNLRMENERSGNWTHAASGWHFAFQRAHRVARYLLGHEPPALHATILLLPEGAKYSGRVTKSGKGYFPLTFAFYWSESNQLQGFASLLYAVTRTMWEYQHLLVDTKVIAPVGKTKGDRTTNDEARSQCWFHSTFLALEAGTTADMEYSVSRANAAMSLLEQSAPHAVSTGGSTESGASASRRPRIRLSQALPWGEFFEIESVANYLKQRGVPKLRVVANHPAEMNDVLSVCRAMTQHPLDVTATNGYPPPQVQFVPFFPAKLKGYRPIAGSRPQ